MYSKISSAAITGLSAQMVSVETDVGYGLPAFEMSGYLTAEVKEAKERVRVAIKNAGCQLKPQRIVVNISPADVRKDGTGFDLPIAVGVLLANELIRPERLQDCVLIGELSLDGGVNGVNGILPCICEAREQGRKSCIVPYENLEECRPIAGIQAYGASDLREVIAFCNGTGKLPMCGEPDGRQRQSIPGRGRSEQRERERTETAAEEREQARPEKLDFADIRGQQAAKRATMIAVAGMHNLLYVGAPGSGKSMMAKRIPTIMPSLTYEESLELTKIYSVAGLLHRQDAWIRHRPFRSPHHNTTATAMLGGGRNPRPGEVTLAAQGVLFLDELTEYTPAVLESLRQPLEDKKITIVRMNYACTYPADFMLVAAMNPCKCGYYPDRNRCTCTEYEIRRYLGRISQPLWDRFDLSVQIDNVPFREIVLPADPLKKDQEQDRSQTVWTSAGMRERIERARQIQLERFHGKKRHFNAEMTQADLRKYCSLDEKEQKLMERAFDKLHLTGRGYHKILKTARTIADLDGKEKIGMEHLSEAVSFRNLKGGV